MEKSSINVVIKDYGYTVNDDPYIKTASVYRQGTGAQITHVPTNEMKTRDLSSPLTFIAGLIDVLFGKAVIVNITDGTKANYHIITRDSLESYMKLTANIYTINNHSPKDFSAGYFYQEILIEKTNNR